MRLTNETLTGLPVIRMAFAQALVQLRGAKGLS